MNNSFKNQFLESIYTKPKAYGLIEFNNSKSMNYEYYIFTEGTTDEVFYSNLNHSLFTKKIKFIPMQDKEHAIDKTDIAKTGVMRTFNEIKNKLGNDLKKCIFIVDHDYEGVFSSNIEVESDLKKNFTVTKGYSFENVFLEDNNIDLIFNYFGLPDVNLFKNKLNVFVKEISEYNRLKASIVITYMKGSDYSPAINYKSKYKSDEIFKFDFAGMYKYYFRKDIYDIEVCNQQDAVFNNENSKRYYYDVSSKFINNINYIRGHDLYRFLQFYLWQIHNIDLRPKSNNIHYKNIIKVLNVDMDFKNGNGVLILDVNKIS